MAHEVGLPALMDDTKNVFSLTKLKNANKQRKAQKFMNVKD